MDNSDEDCDLSDDFTNSKRKIVENQSKPSKKIKHENKGGKKNRRNVLGNEELRELINSNYNETDCLCDNNLLSLQLHEILNGTKIKNKLITIFNEWYEKFQSFLTDLPEYELKQTEIKFSKSNVLTKKQSLINELFSFNKRDCVEEFTIKLRQPENVSIFGLYDLNVRIAPKLLVDINLTMPKNCLLHKDYLNNRYLLKRNYYLLYIKHFLEKQRICQKVSFLVHKSLNYNILTIVLNEKVEICLFSTPPNGFFKNSRFLPNINNCKSSNNCTPFYNNILAHDCMLIENHKFAKSQLEGVFLDGIKLLIVWLEKRDLNSYFVENLLVFLICYLIKIKKINKHMSVNQILQNFWYFFIETNLESDLITLCDDEEIINGWKKLEKLPEYPIIFLDKTGYYNLTQFFHVNFYHKLKTECELSVKLLNNNFFLLFIAPTNYQLQYDLILNINVENLQVNHTEKINYFPFGYLEKTNEIVSILQKGLNKRIKNVNVLNQIKTNQLFGISLTENAFNCLEKGPELNDIENSTKFRLFWGCLTSDRRFKDGTCCVCLYFQCETYKERRNIIKKIIDYLLCEKLSLNSDDYELFFNQFEDMISNKKITDYGNSCNEEASFNVTLTADELSKKLRGLNDRLPLGITGVQGISDSFSFTEVFPPMPTNYKCGKKITNSLENNIIINDRKQIGCLPRFIQTIDSVLHLEYSTKWPKTLQGLQKMKTAFFLEITKLLMEKYQIISNVNLNYFDVLYKGYVFRYFLYVQKEIAYLKREININGVISYKTTMESMEYERKFEVLPKIVSVLKGIQFRYPSFGPSTALVKRWLRSHLIDNYHFSDIIINLINASLYLNPRNFEQSQTPQIGFLRFLDFLAKFQWKLHPIIVDFNQEIPKDKLMEINSTLPVNLKLRIITPYDNYESIFTKTNPTAEILKRVLQLCQDSLEVIFKKINLDIQLSNKRLFVPNLSGFNLIINLKRLLNPRRHEQVLSGIPDEFVQLEKFKEEKCRKIPVVNFDPVQFYLRELRQNYGEFAEFFHDTYGGNTIGVLWKPSAYEVCDFKVSQISGKMLRNDKLTVNLDTLIEDFAILGKDLVKNIENM